VLDFEGCNNLHLAKMSPNGGETNLQKKGKQNNEPIHYDGSFKK
jgi:hypothetical protein